LQIISLFSGCGGLDKGFEQAGFEVAWANEFDSKIWDTFEYNFPHTRLDRRSIVLVPTAEIPPAMGVIGGPPCQSWSEAGALRGIQDERGKLFFEFMRVLRDKKPLFFLAENVSGMLAQRHEAAFRSILRQFRSAGYRVSWQLLNAKDFGVPQDRQRVVFVGYRKDMGIDFAFPGTSSLPPTLKDAIWDLRNSAQPARTGNKTHGAALKILNHEYLVGGFSTIFMSRNRVRGWHEQSYTIQAGGRHAPIHPQANKMIPAGLNKFIFDPQSPKPYRRLSVRECARIQTFPDDFKLIYDSVADGYKMVGNAVPVNFAMSLALKIKKDIQDRFGSAEPLYGNADLRRYLKQAA
jgi:DNA (cytosine-5)-methyltransferase 1